mmetsp:Transcript_28795/g.70031  ORF Transcript_28795/g.70031 Transcript_28795/m.70031 type:complete len:247 (+) Transcript_28795:24-764(+)
MGGASCLKGEELASYIDHTLLDPAATAARVEQLCREAVEHEFACVCINLTHLPLVQRGAFVRSSGEPLRVCVVVGFPLGATSSEVKAFEARQAVAGGADEVDMVAQIGSLVAGDYDEVRKDVAAVVYGAHSASEVADKRPLVKVILETSLLTNEQIEVGCRAAVDGGADFVKTSTGFAKGGGGATVDHVALMAAAVGQHCAVKASGGIRTAEAARAMIAAGASRIGTSSGIAIVAESIESKNTASY